MQNRIIFPSLLIFCVSLLFGCAKIATPTGGQRDVTAPKIITVSPNNNSVKFEGNLIKISFDEYFTLNNPTENILFSPPLSKSPEYSIKGKTLVIKFKDTLQPQTTYNILFSNAIKDYHEGNPLGMFHYSFSTGDSIDRFKIKGKIVDAKKLESSKDFFVMLYKNNIDSLPLTSLPNYITKSNDKGDFVFNNISPGSYKIFAIKDINSNNKYDLPNEEIAFLDTIVYSYSSDLDSLSDNLKISIPDLTLYSFVATDTIQKLQRYENPMAGIYIFPYKIPVEVFSATGLNNSYQYFEKFNTSRDTVTWYFKQTVKDSLLFKLVADNQVDTVILKPYTQKQVRGRNRVKEETKLKVTAINKGEYNKPLTLRFSYPIQPIDSFDVMICTIGKNNNDTIIRKFSVPDSFVTQIAIPLEYIEKKSYTILIRDSIFWGYNNTTNDSLKIDFVAKALKDYGTLTMNYTIPSDGKRYVATLYKGETPIITNNLSSSETISYPFLNPDSYKIVIFCDDNENGKWDSGDYYNKKQAEKTFIFPQTITIRAYWESEETFDLREFK